MKGRRRGRRRRDYRGGAQALLPYEAPVVVGVWREVLLLPVVVVMVVAGGLLALQRKRQVWVRVEVRESERESERRI